MLTQGSPSHKNFSEKSQRFTQGLTFLLLEGTISVCLEVSLPEQRRDPSRTSLILEILEEGVEPLRKAIRGGTDGSRLSYMGLLTPNIFAGGQQFHSKREWIPISTMEKSVQVILNIAQVWCEKSR